VKVQLRSLVQSKVHQTGPTYVSHGGHLPKTQLLAHSSRPKHSIDFKTHLKNLAKGLGLRIHVYGGKNPGEASHNTEWNNHKYQNKQNLYNPEFRPHTTSNNLEEESSNFFEKTQFKVSNDPDPFGSNVPYGLRDYKPQPNGPSRYTFKVQPGHESNSHPTYQSLEESPMRNDKTRDYSSFEVYQSKYKGRDGIGYNDRNQPNAVKHAKESELDINNIKHFRGSIEQTTFAGDERHRFSDEKQLQLPVIPKEPGYYYISSDGKIHPVMSQHPKLSYENLGKGVPNYFPSKPFHPELIRQPNHPEGAELNYNPEVTSPVISWKDRPNYEGNFAEHNGFENMNHFRRFSSRLDSDESLSKYPVAFPHYVVPRGSAERYFDKPNYSPDRESKDYRDPELEYLIIKHQNHTTSPKPEALSGQNIPSNVQGSYERAYSSRSGSEPAEVKYSPMPRYSQPQPNHGDSALLESSKSRQSFSSSKVENEDPYQYKIMYTQDNPSTPPTRTIDEPVILPSQTSINVSSIPTEEIRLSLPTSSIVSGPWVGIHSSDALMDRTTSTIASPSAGPPTPLTASTVSVDGDVEKRNIKGHSSIASVLEKNESGSGSGNQEGNSTTSLGHEIRLGLVLDEYANTI
jgi:hypothetical protein